MERTSSRRSIEKESKMTNQVPAIALYLAPTVEPLSLEEVKTYLRIDGESENSLINSMISAARMAAEKYMRVSINSQKWKISFNDITPQEVTLFYGPATAIDSVKTIDESGATTTFDAANYYLTAGNRTIYFKEIPSAQRVEIIYSAGIAADASSVPVLIKQGLLAHIASMYERKQPGADASETARALYNFYRDIMI